MVTQLSRWERAVGRLPWPVSRLFSAYLYVKVCRRKGWTYSLTDVFLEMAFGIAVVRKGGNGTLWKDNTSMPLIPLERFSDWLERRLGR